MLQSDPKRKRTDPDNTGRSTNQSEFISHADIVRFLRRFAFTISVGVSLGILCGVLIVMTTEPTYTARAQLLIDPSTSQVLRDNRYNLELSIDTAQVEGQIAVLNSETIAKTVIKKLRLTEDPEFISPPKPFFYKIFLFEPITLRPADDPEKFTEFKRSRLAISSFRDNLYVRREGLSYAINIWYTAGDPEKAAQIANATAEAYVRDRIDTMAQAARQSSRWLETRFNQLREQLNGAARNLQKMRAGHDYRILESDQTTPSAADAGPNHVSPRQTRKVDKRTPTTLVELESTLQSFRKMYESYHQAFNEVVQRQTYPVSTARVITSATPPLSKSKPQSKLILAVSTLAGALLGLGIAFLRFTLDGSVRDAKQLEERTGLECIAQIPRLTSASAALGLKRGKTLDDRGALPPASHSFREVIEAPFSQFSGALKTVKTAISYNDADQEIFTIGVTSCLPREGKSTVAGNLGALFSISAFRTLIIDADIHNATLTNIFAPQADTGLLDVLAGTVTTDECIARGRNEGPDILPVVAVDGKPISYELLASERMLTLLRNLRPSYDVVLVDLPPFNPIVDGLSISALFDGVLLVAEWGSTPVDLLADMAYSLKKARANVLGAVITKVDPSEANTNWRKAVA